MLFLAVFIGLVLGVFLKLEVHCTGISLVLQVGVAAVDKGLHGFDWSSLIGLEREVFFLEISVFQSASYLTYLIFPPRINFLFNFHPFLSDGRFLSLRVICFVLLALPSHSQDVGEFLLQFSLL